MKIFNLLFTTLVFAQVFLGFNQSRLYAANDSTVEKLMVCGGCGECSKDCIKK